MNINQNKPPYLIGILCIIPLIGAIVGFVLVLLGLFHYKNRKLIYIGVGGILFTVFVYGSLIYQTEKLGINKELSTQMAQDELNNIKDKLEFYKYKKGEYPKQLEDIYRVDKFSAILDPFTFHFLKGKAKIFQYINYGDSFLVYSVGVDGIANTKDDIYPSNDTSTINKNTNK